MTTAGSTSFNEQILAGLRPNFFELVAQEAMQGALRPAWQYVCKVFVQSRPDLLEHVWTFSDELYLVLDSLLQLYFITRHSGSFSENFYYLKRVPWRDRNGLLGTREKWTSLCYLVTIPYLIVKMDSLYSRLQEENDVVALSWQRGEAIRVLVKLLFFKTYPYLHSLWEGSKFIFRVRYLFRQTEFYSPLLWLTGVTLSRQLETELTESPSSQSGTAPWRRLLNSLLPLTVFALKLLEWWFSSERAAAVRTMTSLPIPPPPKPIEPSPEGIQLPSNPQLCPICLQRRTDPTAVITSGYVFCYSCILGYLRRHGQCPVTCLPTVEKQMIRLYSQQQNSS